MHDEPLPKRLERTTLYESPWVNLYRDRVELPNGQLIEAHHMLEFGRGAVAVIVENSRGEVLLERVARYPTQAVSWELPAGGIEGDESVLAAAQREVEEETGYQTANPTLLYRYHPLNGISNMVVYVVHCTAGERVGDIDTNEIQGFRWFSVRELSAMIAHGEITDGLALTGFLLYLQGKSQPPSR
jgi:ADP-ribose pyrophosphatase